MSELPGPAAAIFGRSMVFKWFSLIWRILYGPTGEEVSQCWETYGRQSGRQGFIRTNFGFFETLCRGKTVEMQALIIGLHITKWSRVPPSGWNFLTFTTAFLAMSVIRVASLKAI